MKTGDPGSTVAIGFLKDHIKILLFILLNSTLPLSYLLSNSITSFDSHLGKDALWSGTKFILMWNPLLVRSLSFAFKFSKSKRDNKYNFRAKEEMVHLMFSFPFVNPLNNIYNAFRLYRLEYGMGRFEPKNCPKVEQIGKEASSAGMYHSFLESGPQCVVQLKMISSTSSICFAQIVAIHSKTASPGSPDSVNFFGFSDKFKADNTESIRFALWRDSAANFLVIIAKNIDKHPYFLSKSAISSQNSEYFHDIL